METGHQNSLPDWNEIIEGIKTKTDDTSKHVGKHRKGSHVDTEAGQPTRFPPVNMSSNAPSESYSPSS